MGVAPNVQAWFYSNPSFDFWTDLTAWTALLANETNIPWVHSISYGDQGEFQPVRYSTLSIYSFFFPPLARAMCALFRTRVYCVICLASLDLLLTIVVGVIQEVAMHSVPEARSSWCVRHLCFG